MLGPFPSTRPTPPATARAVRTVWLAVVAFSLTSFAAGEPPPSPWPVRAIEPDAVWFLNLPDLEPFEASGLALRADGTLLAVSNRGSEVYRIAFLNGTNAANLALESSVFTDRQLRSVPRARPRGLDVEGIALDPRGNVYLCVETERWILRCSPGARKAERLGIDWSPVHPFFSKSEPNASFEGLAIGNGRLYVANERSTGRIIEVDLDSLAILTSFEVRTHRSDPWDTHYSDLSWFQGRLYVLCRESRAILEVDPATRAVTAEYSFLGIEGQPAWRFQTRIPLVGIMEGLAVDARHFWLVTDNNNLPRLAAPHDRRPALFRCPRPSAAAPAK